MDELLPKVAVTPETVASVIADWRAGATVPPQAGGPDPAKRSEGGATRAATDANRGTTASPPSRSKIAVPPQAGGQGTPGAPSAHSPQGRAADPASSSEWERAVGPKENPPPAKPEVWLEVGFGGGEHLAWQAARNPGTLMIGAEPFINGAAKLLSAIDEQALANVRVRHGDARDLMAAIPDASIDRAFVLHPDPWPKRKHWKRRIVSVPFLIEMHRLLAPGAELRVASDIPDYVRWTLVMRDLAEEAGARFDWTAKRMSDWTARPDDWPQTRYEAKAIREGRTPTYLSFRRV